MLLKTETYQHQSKLAQYCRDGIMVEIPGTTEGRLPHYRRLVYNVVKDSLESAYPIAFSFFDKSVWEEMTYQFFSEHACQTPQVWKLPFEFYEFAVEQDFAERYKVPFLNDLLYFEWLEVEIYMMEDISYPNHIIIGDWFKDQIILNPEHKLVRLSYPVHLNNPNKILEDQKGDYFLLLFREKDTGKVQFITLSVLFTFLIEKIIEAEKTLEDIIVDIIYFFGVNDENLLRFKIIEFLKSLKEKGFIAGFKN